MKEIKYNRVGDYEIPSLKQERPLPNGYTTNLVIRHK